MLKNKIYSIVCFFLVFAANVPFLAAAEQLQLQPNDRILVLSPHPDDEAIGTSGILQQAVAMKLPVKVVYLTNGDNNELAFLIYRQHPVFRGGLVKMGELRRKESIAAMALFGLNEKQLVFLGYPDFGTLRVFTQFWGEGRSYKGFLTRAKSVPYEDAFTPEAPYVGESILGDLEKILSDFKPTKIFTTHPADTNSDHRAAFLFLTVALWDLNGKIPSAAVYPFVVHSAKWPIPRGFHPELCLEPPANLKDNESGWWNFELSADQIEKKKAAFALYKSQNAYNPRYLPTFARKNELFAGSPEVILKNTAEEGIDWNALEQIQKIEGNVIDEEIVDKKYLRTVSYAHNETYLFVNIQSRLIANELLDFRVYLIGYKPQKPFAQMSKIRIHIGWGRRMVIFNKGSPIMVPGARIQQKGNTINLQIPLAVLDNPENIFACVQVGLAKVPMVATAWRILHLE